MTLNKHREPIQLFPEIQIVQFASEDVERYIMWLQPWRWVDHEDWLEVLNLTDEFKPGRIREILQDMIVERGTELAVFVRNYIRAENYVGGKARELTRRQEQAVRARSEALLSGRSDVHLYVAHQLGIKRSTATELLARADARLEAKILHNAQENAYISSDVEFTPASKRAIEVWMKSHPRQCAGDGEPSTRKGNLVIPACEGHTHGSYELCHPCYKRFGNRGIWPDWLYARVNSIRREHYDNAIEELMRAGKLETAAVLEDHEDFAIAA